MAGREGDNFVVYENDLSVKWGYNYKMDTAEEEVEGQPQVVDSDGDGTPEVFIATTTASNTNGGQALLFDGENGTVKWSDNVTGTQGFRGCGVFDTSGDGNYYFYAGERWDDLWCWDSDGTRLENNVGPTEGWHSGPDFFDQDGDGVYELYWASKNVGRSVAQLYKFDENLNELDNTGNIGTGQGESPPAIHDIDNDGALEAVLTSREESFIISLSDMSVENKIDENGHSLYPVIGDFDNDGLYEFTVSHHGADNDWLKIYEWDNSTGTATRTLENEFKVGPAGSDGRAISMAAQGDIDDDGVLEIIVGNHNDVGDSLYAIDTGENFRKGTWTPSISDGYEFQVRWKADPVSVNSYTLNVSKAVPTIENITVDNALIDRDLDYSGSGAVTATKITVRVRDNDNRSDIAPLRFSLRDNNDSVLVDNIEVTENSVVDENTLDFTYTFDPSDTLADDNLGKFDVRSEARDNAGACHVENFLELGHEEFTVEDLDVKSVRIAENEGGADGDGIVETGEYVKVWGVVDRVSSPGSTSLDNVKVVDNVQGTFDATIVDSDNYEAVYQVSSSEPRTVTVQALDSGSPEVDGSSDNTYDPANAPPTVKGVTPTTPIDPNAFENFKVEVRDNDTLNDLENVKLVLYDNRFGPDTADNERSHYTFLWENGTGFSEVGPGTGIHIDTGASSAGTLTENQDNFVFNVMLDNVANPNQSWNMYAEVYDNAENSDSLTSANAFSINVRISYSWQAGGRDSTVNFSGAPGDSDIAEENGPTISTITSNVNFDVASKLGDNWTSDTTSDEIPAENTSFAQTSGGTQTAMSTSYQDVYTDVGYGESLSENVYYYLDVPSDLTPASYSTTFYLEVAEH